MIFKPGDTILLQGDSITDAGRDRDDPNSLGTGYAMMAAGWLSAQHPEHNLTFLNRGISGNRTCDLVTRWDADCIGLEPDWVSLYIGVNNTWRRYDSDDPTPVERFEAEYRILLGRLRAETGAEILLVDPFVLPHPDDRKAWRQDLDPKIEVVQRLATEFETLHLPLDAIFAEACTRRNPEFWAGDGVHPTVSGHALIAQSWLAAVDGS